MITLERLVVREFRGIRELEPITQEQVFRCLRPKWNGQKRHRRRARVRADRNEFRGSRAAVGATCPSPSTPLTLTAARTRKGDSRGVPGYSGAAAQGASPHHSQRQVAEGSEVLSGHPANSSAAVPHGEPPGDRALPARDHQVHPRRAGKRAEMSKSCSSWTSLRTIRANLQRIANSSDKDAGECKEGGD